MTYTLLLRGFFFVLLYILINDMRFSVLENSFFVMKKTRRKRMRIHPKKENELIELLDYEDLDKIQNVCYIGFTGSYLYDLYEGDSDIDLIFLYNLKKEYIFPHHSNNKHIPGFDNINPDYLYKLNYNKKYYIDLFNTGERKELEFEIFSLPNFLNQCFNGSPNKIDILFTPKDKQIINELDNKYFICGNNDNIFNNTELILNLINYKTYFSFMNYSTSEFNKATEKESKGKKRKEYIDIYGFDIKSAINSIRLLLELYDIQNNLPEIDKKNKKKEKPIIDFNEIRRYIRKNEYQLRNNFKFYKEMYDDLKNKNEKKKKINDNNGCPIFKKGMPNMLTESRKYINDFLYGYLNNLYEEV